MLIAAAVAAPVLLLDTEPAEAAPAENMLGGEPFSEARLAALRAARAPVFVYFTADWCLTCKVNERGAMAGDAVAEAFRGEEHPRARRGLDPGRSGDRAVSRAARALGRAALPLSIRAGGGEPEILPQLLRPGAWRRSGAEAFRSQTLRPAT